MASIQQQEDCFTEMVPEMAKLRRPHTVSIVDFTCYRIVISSLIR